MSHGTLRISIDMWIWQNKNREDRPKDRPNNTEGDKLKNQWDVTFIVFLHLNIYIKKKFSAMTFSDLLARRERRDSR